MLRGANDAAIAIVGLPAQMKQMNKADERR
jgi:hypothetical protein